MTAGEQPTVFSLKSSLSLPSRPPVGGEYGAIFFTASRGSGIPHLDRTGVTFQALGAGDGRDRKARARADLRA